MRKSFIVQHLATRGLSRGDEQELRGHEWTNRLEPSGSSPLTS